MKPTIEAVRGALLREATHSANDGHGAIANYLRELAASLDGYALVPVEPTMKMVIAASESMAKGRTIENIYRAMLKEASHE